MVSGVTFPLPKSRKACATKPLARPANARFRPVFRRNTIWRLPKFKVAADGAVTVISKHVEFGQGTHAGPAVLEETPPQVYEFSWGFVTEASSVWNVYVAEVWRRGSVVTSWLLDLSADALVADPQLGSYSGSVSDSGEGRWTIDAAVEQAVPVPVLSSALFARFRSRQQQGTYGDKLLSAMRFGFGGHVEKSE